MPQDRTLPSPAEATPQVSAFVTAYARDLLLQAVAAIQSRGGQVAYLDTDAIAFSAPLTFNLAEVNEELQRSRGQQTASKQLPMLGQLVEVYPSSTITKMTFLAPKVYYVETTEQNHSKVAGVAFEES